MPETASLPAHRAQVARAVLAKDPSAEAEARRDLAAAKLADYITRTVDAAPPLTPEQAGRLRSLLPSVSGEEHGNEAA